MCVRTIQQNWKHNKKRGVEIINLKKKGYLFENFILLYLKGTFNIELKLKSFLSTGQKNVCTKYWSFEKEESIAFYSQKLTMLIFCEKVRWLHVLFKSLFQIIVFHISVFKYSNKVTYENYSSCNIGMILLFIIYLYL